MATARRASNRTARDPAAERREQIFAAMQPLRVIFKKKSKTVIEHNVYPIKNLYMMMSDDELCNSSLNRNPVWGPTKSQSYIMSLLVEVTAPRDFLVRQTEPESADELGQLHIFDGNNRLQAIRGFMDNSFPIKVGVLKIFYNELPRSDRQRFDNISCSLMKLLNCPLCHACEIAEKRNEGTIMSIGEKATLISTTGTPRSNLLSSVVNIAPFMQQNGDRAGGVKVIAQVIQSIETKGGVCSAHFKVSESHGPTLRDFFVKDNAVSYVVEDDLVQAFMEVGELCPEGEVPESITEMSRGGRKQETSSMFFYLAVAALVVTILRDGCRPSEEGLKVRVKKMLETARRTHAEGKKVNINSVLIEGLCSPQTAFEGLYV